jgi:hypothetical protein
MEDEACYCWSGVRIEEADECTARVVREPMKKVLNTFAERRQDVSNSFQASMTSYTYRSFLRPITPSDPRKGLGVVLPTPVLPSPDMHDRPSNFGLCEGANMSDGTVAAP